MSLKELKKQAKKALGMDGYICPETILKEIVSEIKEEFIEKRRLKGQEAMDFEISQKREVQKF